MKTPFQELKASKEDLLYRFSEGSLSQGFQEGYTSLMDTYFRGSIQESPVGRVLFKNSHPFAVVAVGGYGRRELSVHSDIDVMILFPRNIPPQAKDLAKKSHSLFHWLQDRDKLRKETFGDAGSLLEPQLKEGVGGLRDYHHILWLGKALFRVKEPRDLEYQGGLSHNEYRELESHVRFLWLVRSHLHFLSGRKNDRLGFEHQEEIATRLGFEDEADLLAVENFLGRLHASMAYIKSLHQSFMLTHTPRGHKSRTNLGSSDTPEGLHLYKGELNFDSPTLLLSHPLLMMDIFEQSARLGLPLSQEARRLVREFLFLVINTLCESQQAFQRFLSIMNSPNTTPVLEQMLETGFLDVFLPEFGRIKNRVQFDSYHIYPVGSHLLQTVAYLKSIPKAREIVFADILSARIYTWRDSTAVDVFKVTPPLDPLRTQEIWDNVEKDFLDTSKGKLCLDLRLQQKHTHRALPKRSKGPSRPARLSFDNGSSDFFTIVQVIADDREGLLYTITHTLFEMRLNIRIAKISTKRDQAADTFYVRDLEGQKVEDDVQVKEIKEALLHRLAHQSV